MNQIQLNEFGLADLLAVNLRQIEALASAANYLLSNSDASVYLRDAAELVNIIRTTAIDAEQLRAQWQARIPRVSVVCSGGVI